MRANTLFRENEWYEQRNFSAQLSDRLNVHYVPNHLLCIHDNDPNHDSVEVDIEDLSKLIDALIEIRDGQLDES